MMNQNQDFDLCYSKKHIQKFGLVQALLKQLVNDVLVQVESKNKGNQNQIMQSSSTEEDYFTWDENVNTEYEEWMAIKKKSSAQ